MFKTAVFHPFLFAIFPVVMIYAHNIYIVPAKEAVFPIAMMVIFSFSIFFITKLIFKSWNKAGIITSIVIALIFSYGHIYSQIGGLTIGNFIIGRHRFMIIPYIIALIIGSYYIFKTKRRLDNATKISNAIAFSLIILVFINIGFYLFEKDTISINNILEEPKVKITNQNNISINLGESSIKPDIYYIVLDGYGGYESLKNDLNFDNTEFLNEIENRGFFVVQNSHSNYAETILSIPSTLNMRYFNYLSDELGKDSQDWHSMYGFWENNEVMMNLKSSNYTTINFQKSVYEQKTDHTLCKSTSLIPNNELMRVVTKVSIFEYFIYAFSEQEQRSSILCGFKELSEVRNQFEGPIFVHAHMNIPHPPYLFGPDGEQIIYKPYHDDDEIDAERYLGTVQYANKRIIEIIDNLQNQDKQPVIIVQSDHGSDFNNFDWDNPTDEMIKQRMTNLSTYYFPNGGNEHLYEEITPVNSFRLLFNVYFNSTYPLLEDKIYWSSYSKPYDFRDVTELVNLKN